MPIIAATAATVQQQALKSIGAGERTRIGCGNAQLDQQRDQNDRVFDRPLIDIVCCERHGDNSIAARLHWDIEARQPAKRIIVPCPLNLCASWPRPTFLLAGDSFAFLGSRGPSSIQSLAMTSSPLRQSASRPQSRW